MVDIVLEKKRSRTVTMRGLMLTEEQWAYICALAKTEQVGKSDSARYLLNLGIQAHQQTQPQEQAHG